MAVAFSQLSWWSWSGKHRDAKLPSGSSKNSTSTTDVNKLEFENLKFPIVNVAPSTSKRVKRKWHSRKEREVDKEYDVVLVPSDGGCLSGSESDDSDWSIGWLEPHGAGFCSDDDDSSDDSFAVLVPCYGRGRNDIVNAKKAPNDNFLETIGRVPDLYSAENHSSCKTAKKAMISQNEQFWTKKERSVHGTMAVIFAAQLSVYLS